jgi:heat shock protein HslJ
VIRPPGYHAAMSNHIANRFHAAFFACLLCLLALEGCKSKSHVEQPAIAGEPPVEWRLTTMQGSAVTAPPQVTLQLSKDSTMSGKSFVNNYFGNAAISPGSAISLGQVGSTMMAASQELMNFEQTYFQLLGKVNRYKVSGDTLTLLHDDEKVLEFVRNAAS